MFQLRGYVCAWMVRLSGALALTLVASSALAQTAAGGMSHTVILKSDGTVWTVGANASGQLGDNTTTQRKSPIQVSGLNGVVAVAAGDYHSMAITWTLRTSLEAARGHNHEPNTSVLRDHGCNTGAWLYGAGPNQDLRRMGIHDSN